MRNTFPIKFSLLIATLSLLFVSPSVKAITDPDSLSIQLVRGYSGVVEPGDVLYVGMYSIQYETIPTEAARDTYVVRFIKDNLEIQSVRPTVFVDNGYGFGLFSFYFTDEEVTDLEIVFGTSYTVRIQGNPAFFPSPPTVQTNSIFHVSVLATKLGLQNNVIDFAEDLQTKWLEHEVDLITIEGTTVVFTASGEVYFLGTIPVLKDALPHLFLGTNVTPDFSDIPRTHDQTQRESLLNFWDGTWWGDNFESMAATWSTSDLIIKTVIFMGFMLMLGAGLMKVPNMSGSFVAMVYAFMFPTGAYMGMIDVYLAGFITFGMCVILAYGLFYGRTG